MNLKTISIIGLLIINAASANAEVVQKETRGFIYSLYIPSSYDVSQKYPLIIAFHWSTARGTDMLERWQEQAEKKGYIVACPDSKDSSYWDLSEKEDVFRMLKEIKTDYSIDDNRIFLTGFSAGANFAYYLGLNHPDIFCAVAAFSGPFSSLKGYIHLTSDSNKHIPIFILHGDKDNLVDISEGKFAKEELEKFGYNVKFMKLSGLDHTYPSYVSWSIINWFEKIKQI